MYQRFKPLGLALLLLAIVAAMPVRAGAEGFDVLKGQSIRAIIGGKPGAGTDAIGRAFFAALGRVLPSSPINVQLISVGAGAGAVKELFDARGRLITVAIFGNGPIYSQLLASAALPYDVSKLHWLGSLADNRRVIAMRKGLGEPTFETLRKLGRQPIVPSSDAVSPNNIESLLLNAILGLHMKVVPGFSDAQIETMLLAGDGDVRLAGSYQLAPMIESGDMIPVLRIGSGAYPAAMKALPTLSDYARPGVSKDLVFLMETLNLLGRPYAAAPGTDPAVVAALRAAFDIVVKDADYLAAMAREETIGEATSGAELADAMKRLFGGTTQIGALVRAYRDCGVKMSDDPRARCD